MADKIPGESTPEEPGKPLPPIPLSSETLRDELVHAASLNRECMNARATYVLAKNKYEYCASAAIAANNKFNSMLASASVETVDGLDQLMGNNFKSTAIELAKVLMEKK